MKIYMDDCDQSSLFLAVTLANALTVDTIVSGTFDDDYEQPFIEISNMTIKYRVNIGSAIQIISLYDFEFDLDCIQIMDMMTGFDFDVPFWLWAFSVSCDHEIFFDDHGLPAIYDLDIEDIDVLNDPLGCGEVIKDFFIEEMTSGKHNVCIYHEDSIDGITAAFITKCATGAFCIPSSHYKKLPMEYLICLDDIIIVDLNYPTEILKEIGSRCDTLTIINHHDTFLKQTPMLDDVCDGFGYVTNQVNSCGVLENKSAAALAYEHFRHCITVEDFSIEQINKDLVDYVSDYDTMTYSMENTINFNKFLSTVPMNLSNWDVVNCSLFSPDLKKNMLDRGRSAFIAHQAIVDWCIKNALRMVEFEGYTVPLINIPKTIYNEVIEKLTPIYPFVMTYYDNPEGRAFRLCSMVGNPSYVKVSGLAERYGGGGHITSAGFRVTRDHELCRL